MNRANWIFMPHAGHFLAKERIKEKMVLKNADS
jgi:hypothetical protein